ncbi:hypothetical protein MXD61_15115 [Frankia sp. AgPm24]|uniref:DUF2178 domain-containing protein n=1 Tax=Frankia umida TaxID=573489 RepID=A0ABT0K158_9ACTN|nr:MULTISPECIES: hypothetical protein [Frankia]MCK9877492.1 hypothetical protein [Frankia umida]MCK9923183.1 hypothetical protein [Frankia sp. AgPm24]
MTTSPTRTPRPPRTHRLGRLATTAVLLLGGGAITLGAWLGGDRDLALVLAVFYVVIGVVAFVVAGGRSDVAALLRVAGDERQRSLDLRATALSALAMETFCVGGLVVDLARGGSGYPWALVCAVGGVSYAIALAVVRTRH